MTKDKTYLFESEKIGKAVAKLAVPSVMATIVMVLYSIADTYFVGMLNNPVETAAVTLSAPVILAFNAVNNLFGVGTGSLISRCLGRKDYESAEKASVFGLYMSLAFSLLISFVCTVFIDSLLDILGADTVTSEATSRYLFWTVSCGSAPAIMNVVLSNMVRSEGCSVNASIGVISGCLLNIILDPVFVLPQFLGMGAAGAGCATFISNTFALLYLVLLTVLRKGRTCICLDIRKFSFSKEISKEIFGVGLPSALQNLLNVTGSIILNNFTSAYGAGAVSAMGIAHKANLLPLYISMGITQGVMSLIGYNWASGNIRRMKEAIINVLYMSVIINLVLSIIYFFCSYSVITIFMKDSEIVQCGGRLLRLMSCGIIFMGIDFLGVAVYQAIGKGRYSLIFAILRKIVLEIPAIIVFNKIWPLYGMGLSQAFAELILAVAALLMLHHIFSLKRTGV